MDEVGQRVQEYQQAISKRDEIISRLSASLQSTIQQRDQLRATSEAETQQFAREILVLKEQLAQTSAFLRNKDFSGVNAAEFIRLKNQLIASDAENNTQRGQIASLKAELQSKTQALLDHEASSLQLRSTHQQLQQELERTWQQLQQTQQQCSAAEQSFSKERAQFESRLDMYSSQLSEQSLLDASLSATQQRVEELSAELKSTASQLQAATAAAASSEAQLRARVEELESQLASARESARQRTAGSDEQRALLERHQTALAASAAELTTLRQEKLELSQQLQLTADARDALAGHLKTVGAECQSLQQQLRTLGEDREALQRRVGSVSEELAATKQDLQSRTEERDTARTLAESVAEERDDVTKQLQSVVEERGTLLKRLDVVMQVREEAGSQLTEANHQRDQLCQALAATNQQRDELTRQLSAANQQQVELAKQIESLEQQQALAVEQLSLKTKQFDQMATQMGSAGQQRDQLNQQLVEASQQQVTLSQQVAELSRQRDALAGNDQLLKTVTQQRDVLSQQLSEAARQSEAATEELRAATEWGSELSEKLGEVTKQRDTYLEQLSKLSQEGASTRQRLAEVTQQLAEVSQQRDALAGGEQRLREVTQQLADVSQQRDALAGGEQRLREVTEQREVLTRQLGEANQRNDIVNCELKTLSERTDSLTNELCEVTKQRDACMQQMKGAVEEKAGVIRQLSEVTQQLADVSQQRDRLEVADGQRIEIAQQRDELARKLSEITQQSGAVNDKLKVMTERVNSLSVELSEVVQQRDTYITQLNQAAQNRASVDKQLSDTVDQCGSLGRELERAVQDRDNLSVQLTSLSQQRDAAWQQRQADCDRLHAQLTQVEAQLTEQADQRARLSAALEAVTAERDGLTATLTELSGERARLALALDGVVAERSRLSAALEQRPAEREVTARLTEQLSAAQAQTAALQLQLDEVAARETAAHERLTAAEAERARTSAELDSLRQRVAVLTTSEQELRASLSSAEGELVESRGQLARVSASEAALRGDLNSAKDVSNAAIKLRARAESTGRRLEEAERRVVELERERDMLHNTHERYVRETTAQLAAAEAEAEKLRVCMLVRGLTSPRRTSVTSPRKAGMMSPEEDGARSPRKRDLEAVMSHEKLSMAHASPRRELFTTDARTKEMIEQSTGRSEVAEAAMIRAESQGCRTDPIEICPSSADSESTAQPSARDSGLTTLSGQLELSSRQLSQLESLVVAGSEAAETAASPAAAGQPRVSANVAELVSRLSTRLSEAHRQQQLQRQRWTCDSDSGAEQKTINYSERSPGAAAGTASVRGSSPQCDMDSSAGDSRGAGGGAQYVVQVARRALAALPTAERQQARLEALETRVVSELSALRNQYKSALQQNAGAAADIVLIDSSYEVKLLRAKLEACGSISAALRTQLREHRQLLHQFQNMFAALSQHSGGGRPGSEAGADGAAAAGDAVPVPAAGVDSARDSLPAASGGDDGALSDPGPGPASPASPCLREAPASARSLGGVALSGPLLVSGRSGVPVWEDSVIGVESGELPVVSEHSESGEDIPESGDHSKPPVPPFDSKLFSESCRRDGDDATFQMLGAVQGSSSLTSKLVLSPQSTDVTPSSSPRKDIASSSNDPANDRWRELPGTSCLGVDSPGETKSQDQPAAEDYPDADAGENPGEAGPDSALADVALLESLVRENGTLRRALMYEKERAQRLMATADQDRWRCERAAAALRTAEQQQEGLLDCIQRQQEVISRLQRFVNGADALEGVLELSEKLQRCRDSLQVQAPALEVPSTPVKERHLEQAEDGLETQLLTRKQQLDEANQLLQLRQQEMERAHQQRAAASRECGRLQRANAILLDRLRHSGAALDSARAAERRGRQLCRSLQSQLGRAELAADLERSLWQVESRHQLMQQEQRLYQHFLTALPSSTEGTPTSGPSPEPARADVWLFPAGEDRSGSPELRSSAPGTPRRGQVTAGEGPGAPAESGSPTPLEKTARLQLSRLLLGHPNLQAEMERPGADSSAAADAGAADCRSLLQRVEETLQAEFHSMVQAVSARWARRSLQELRRAQAAGGEEQESAWQEKERLQQEVRGVQDWLEETYSRLLTELHGKLQAQRQQLLQTAAEVCEKAESLSKDPQMTNEALRNRNKHLQERLTEAGERQRALEEQLKSHEQEVNQLREYFQEKVRFTEKMYSDEIRRLIQQQAQSEAGLTADGQLSELSAGVQSLAAELGDGGFTDLGLPPDDGQHASGPAALRLRVDFERRLATWGQELDRKLAARTRDVRTELERKHRLHIAEIERKHATQLAQTVERYKREAEATRREVEKQGSAARAELVQQHQQQLQQLRQCPQDVAPAAVAADSGGGDGPGAAMTSAEGEEARRQLLLSELEALALELRQRSQAEQEEQRRTSEAAARELEARRREAQEEAAQAERELAQLRADSAAAELRRDQEAARWKLELAAGYESQIKAVLSGVSLDEEAATRVARLQAALQRDAGAGLAELEAAHQAALRAFESRHQRQLRELKLQLEASARREHHLQLEQAQRRVEAQQLWTGEEAPVVEVGREELQLLHRDREEQAAQLRQLTGLVRALCQYFQAAERLYRPPSGTAADPEAEQTDRMVLEALAPEEGVWLWAETGRQLPRVERCVREAAARLQAAAASQAAGSSSSDAERLRASERRCAELQLRVDGLTAELTAARQQLSGAAQAEEREALGEAPGRGRRSPPAETDLRRVRDAAEALLETPVDPADSPLLMSRVQQLETLLVELTTQSDLVVAESAREVDDLRQQMEAADKQLRSVRSFLEELTAERESERDEFGREQARLAAQLTATERERDDLALRRRQLEAVEVQNSELLASAQEGEQERTQLRDELKAAVDKIYDLRDIIRSLESQVDELGQREAASGADQLRAELRSQAAVLRQLQRQLAACSCGGEGRAAAARAARAQEPPPREPSLNSTADTEDTELSVCPSLLQELREQIIRMETRLDQRTERLEENFSSRAETLSPDNSQADVRHATVGEELTQLRRRLQRLAEAEEAALGQLRQLELELKRCRASHQDVCAERDALQSQLAEQLLQLSALQARLQRSRLAAEAGVGAADAAGDWKQRAGQLQSRLNNSEQRTRDREKQLAEATCQLEETRRLLELREAELARLGRQRAADVASSPPAPPPPEAAQLRSLSEKYHELQLRHAELLAQLRDNNLPEFVESLLSEKNQQIQDLEHNVRSLSRIQQNSHPASAGESAGRLEVVDSSLLGASDLSPEILRHAATTNASDLGDLSRPDISPMAPDKQQEISPESAAGGRPGSPASEHSFGSAPTVAASEGDARSSRSSAGSRATSAHTTSSGDSIQHLRAALARKKQLLHNRKQQLERTRPSPGAAPPSPPEPPPPPPAEITQVAELSTAEDAAAEQARHQLQQVQARLLVLDPIMAQLDADYSGLRDSLAQLKQQPATSDTELALASQLEEARITIRQQEALQQQLQQHLLQLQQQGVPPSDALLRSVEEQLLTTLRDMELLKLDACGKMHEATALLARHQRHSQQEGDNGSDPASSSGYFSMSPRFGSDEPAGVPEPPPPLQPPPASPHPSTLPWQEESSAGEVSDTASESGAFVSVSQPPESETCLDSKSSCPSLLDGMSGVSDIDGEVERLRGRIGELEQQLGSRGDAPSSGGGQWRDQLEQERSGWSQERQRLQQRIARLEQEQERQHRPGASGGDGDDARLREERGRYLRAESYRRALCWQKRYLMVLLGGYQETEVMTLERMTQLTGGAFRAEGRLFLAPLRKFRAVAWAVVAVHRMGFMVHRWRSGRRLAAAATEGREVAAEAAVRPPTPTSCGSDGSQLDVLDRLVWECSGSTPDLSCPLETRSVASDICSEDLQPYLARFDALLDRQGLPPQGGAARR